MCVVAHLTHQYYKTYHMFKKSGPITSDGTHKTVRQGTGRYLFDFLVWVPFMCF
jgi:hypothetical protein